MLWQYQCQKEGTLFYYQYGGNHPPATHIIAGCPVCRSKRVKLTGRAFKDLNEHSAIKK